MRVAVISDVHGNLHALDAVLTDVDAKRVDAIWCLGDTVGYGPRPNECCAEIARRTTLCLAGNHDLVVRGGGKDDPRSAHPPRDGRGRRRRAQGRRNL